MVAALPSTNDIHLVAQKQQIPPILRQIAVCESNNRQFGHDGKALRGKANHLDIGRYQINIGVWGSEANRLGYDLFSDEGNEAMALEIFKRQHTKPWNASRECWDR